MESHDLFYGLIREKGFDVDVVFYVHGNGGVIGEDVLTFLPITESAVFDGRGDKCALFTDVVFAKAFDATCVGRIHPSRNEAGVVLGDDVEDGVVVAVERMSVGVHASQGEIAVAVASPTPAEM